MLIHTCSSTSHLLLVFRSPTLIRNKEQYITNTYSIIWLIWFQPFFILFYSFLFKFFYIFATYSNILHLSLLIFFAYTFCLSFRFHIYAFTCFIAFVFFSITDLLDIISCPQPMHFNLISAPTLKICHSLLPHGCFFFNWTKSPTSNASIYYKIYLSLKIMH